MILYLLAQLVLDCYNKITKSCEKQQSSAAGVPLAKKILWEVVRMKKMFKRAAASMTAAAMAVSMTACAALEQQMRHRQQMLCSRRKRGSSFDDRQQRHQDRCFHLVLHRRTWFPV